MNPFVSAEAAFRANFAGRLEVGAGLCLWTGDGPVLSLADGWRERQQATPWARTTLAPVWSATKGPASAALLHALAAHGLDPDTPAGRVWPRLGPRLTLGQLMSHQAGLAALDREADASDPAAVATALEAQAPAWLPPDHGYHPRTFGFLVDELVRRITGAPNLGTYWHEAIARPHGIDFWIGLPPEEDGRVARLVPGPAEVPPGETGFYEAFRNPATLTHRAFQSPRGFFSAAEMNQPAAWRAGLAGFGGLGSAEGLAKFYFLLGTDALLGSAAAPWLRVRRADGPDRSLLMPTAFSCGFMLDPLDGAGRKLRASLGAARDAFGHPGAGGSLGFFDPAQRLGFGYVPNRMGLGVLPGRRTQALVRAACGGALCRRDNQWTRTGFRAK